MTRAGLAITLLVSACGGGPTPPQPPSNRSEPATQPHRTGIVVIDRRPMSGIIGLQGGDLEDARRSATAEMDEHCGAGNYTVATEGPESTDSGSPDMQWQLSYACKPAPR